MTSNRHLSHHFGVLIDGELPEGASGGGSSGILHWIVPQFQAVAWPRS
jgi:hypothetical protein